MILRRDIQPDSQKIKALTDMPAPNNKKELQAFLGIINYLGKISPHTVDVCDPLCKLTSSKATWTWNASYQSLFNKAKLLIKSDTCIKFYDDTKALYLETNDIFTTKITNIRSKLIEQKIGSSDMPTEHCTIPRVLENY